MKKDIRNGQIAVELLFIAAVVVTLISGFVVLASSLLQVSVRSRNKLQAFTIAEAGIEYYRWHLAHAPQDFTDGTGNLGPYIHDYYDKDGNRIGRFTLAITPPPQGSTVVTIQSTGSVLADSSVKKIIRVQMGKTSFAKYAIALNSDVKFGAGTEIFGPVFSNGGIRVDGIAHNIVESAQPSYDDPDHGQQVEFGVHTHAIPPPGSGVDENFQPAEAPPSTVQSRPDVFMAGRFFPVPALDLTQVTQTLASLKSLAQTSGTYYASSSAFGYDLELATSGTYSLYKITALEPTPNGCTNTSNELGWATWSIESEIPYASGTIPQGGVIFTEDDLWVRGQISGTRLTVAAGRFPENPSTWANITVNSSTLYTNYDGTDTLGLIAQNNFNVGLYSEDVLRIDAAIVAQNGRVGRYYYSPPNNQNNSNRCGPTVTRQKVTLYGSLISNQRYQFGFTDITGYIERDIIYDPSLLYAPPPRFPLTTDQYTIISWEEVQ